MGAALEAAEMTVLVEDGAAAAGTVLAPHQSWRRSSSASLLPLA